jgi:hypothetical protein
MTDRAPLELFATIPPIVARLAVEMSGANRKPCGLNAAVQLVENDPRFNPYPAFSDVQFEDSVEVFRRVELNAGANRLACLRCATAARGNRCAVLSRGVDRRHHIRPRFRNDDAERFDLINAGVGRIERTRYAIEPDFALDLALEVPLEALTHALRPSGR